MKSFSKGVFTSDGAKKLAFLVFLGLSAVFLGNPGFISGFRHPEDQGRMIQGLEEAKLMAEASLDASVKGSSENNPVPGVFSEFAMESGSLEPTLLGVSDPSEFLAAEGDDVAKETSSKRTR